MSKATNILDETKIIKAIEESLKAKVDSAMKSVIEKAKNDLEKKLSKQVSEIALRLLKMYSVETNSREVIIRVENFT